MKRHGPRMKQNGLARQNSRCLPRSTSCGVTAPTFVAEAKTLAAKGQFDLAIEKLDYAAKLQPDVPELLVTKGDFYLCQLKVPEAAAGYRDALRLKPGFAPAEMKANLCDQLLAAPTSAQGKLALETLVKIYSALEPEKRSAAELKPSRKPTPTRTAPVELLAATPSIPADVCSSRAW